MSVFGGAPKPKKEPEPKPAPEITVTEDLAPPEAIDRAADRVRRAAAARNRRSLRIPLGAVQGNSGTSGLQI